MTIAMAKLEYTPMHIGSWRFDGLCMGRYDIEWYPDLDAGEDPEPALSLCRDCPVLTQCRTYANEAHELYGIWGGTTEYDRGVRKRPHRKAAQTSSRPRKAKTVQVRPVCPSCHSREPVVPYDMGHLTCVDCRIVWSAPLR